MPNARRSDKIEIQDSLVEQEETIPVRLMKELTVKVIGESTKNLYIFNGAGSIVNVDKSDLESIRRKNYAHKSCCGSYSSPYFDIL